MRREVRPRGRRRLADRDALLVLRLRDDGHGPGHAQGDLGLQRDRAARRGLSGRRRWPATPEGTARLRHLRARRAGSGDTAIPADVQAKDSCASPAPGWPSATMRGTSYLAMGGVSMGIAGSIVDQAFFQDYLGMRDETVDMTEFIRRIDRGIYDPEEYDARAGLGAGELPGRRGPQRARRRSARARRRTRDWEICVKMALIARDLMVGNPKLADWASARRRRATTPSPAASRASGSGPTTSPTATSWKRSSTPRFDWNGIRQPYIVATENDALNGVSMLLRPPADRHRPALRRRAHLLESRGRRARHRPHARRRGRRRHPPPHQLRPRRAGLDRRADARRRARR